MGEEGTKQSPKNACDRSGTLSLVHWGVSWVYVSITYNAEVKCLKLAEVSTEFWVNKDPDAYSMDISGVMNELSMERMGMKLTSSKWHIKKGINGSGYAGGGAEMIQKCASGNASFHRLPHLLTAHCHRSSVRCGICKENNKNKTHYRHHHQTDVEAQPLFSGMDTQWEADHRIGPESWRLSYLSLLYPCLVFWLLLILMILFFL